MNKPLTLKQKRDIEKQKKMHKKFQRLAKDKLNEANKSLEKAGKILQQQTNECVEGFITSLVETDNEDKAKRNAERYLNKFIQLDKEFHILIKNEENWSEEKSSQTFDFMIEEYVKDASIRMAKHIREREESKNVK